MKKLELIVGSYELKKFIDILEEVKTAGYTILPDAYGRGRHGKRVRDELTEVNRRNIIICVDKEVKINEAIEKLKPMKDNYSFKAFVYDVTDVL